jgi:hypothetical protein
MLDLQFSILKDKTKLPLRYNKAYENENMHILQVVLDRQAGKVKNISHAMKKEFLRYGFWNEPTGSRD